MKKILEIIPTHPLDHFKKTVTTYPKKPFIIDHFCESELKIWTYEVIDNISNQLAKEIKKNIKAADLPLGALRIGAAFEAEPFYYIALLAIWKLGMVYVPLQASDGDAIAGRIKAIEINLLIVDQKVSQILNLHKSTNTNNLCQFGQTFCLNVDELFSKKIIDISYQSEKICEEQKKLAEDAYITSSSGTTGFPKVIINSYLGLSARTAGMLQHLRISEKSNLLGYVAPQFDAYLLDMLMTFYSGATIYLLKDSIRGKRYQEIPVLFSAALTEYQQPITHAVLLPTVLGALNTVCNNNLECFSTLEAIVTMGEKSQAKVLEPWFKIKEKPLAIWNGYGPTETTIAATLTPILPDAQEFDMGNALPGVNLYLAIKNSGDIIPINSCGGKDFKATESELKKNSMIEGELYIGGLGIGRYLDEDVDRQKYLRFDNESLQWHYNKSSEKNEEIKQVKITLEAKAFPFEKSPERIYRTGDIVKLGQDQSLLFQERIDGCTKVNGRLVKLSDIEKFIDNLKISYIEAREVVIEADQIIACIKVSKEAVDIHTQELKETVSQLLLNSFKSQSSHLRPKFIFWTREFKSSSTSKFDLRATLAQAHFVYRCKDPLCGTEMEQKIAEVWQDILFGGNDKVSKLFPSEKIPFTINAHFEELGGNSITLIQMVNQVWRKLIPHNLQPSSQVPQPFIEWVLMSPRIGRIAQFINCYLSLKVQIADGQMLPTFIIQLDANNKNREEIISSWPLAQQKLIILIVKTNEQDIISNIVAARTREYQRVGPYHIIAGELLPDGVLSTPQHIEIGLKVKQILEAQGDSVFLTTCENPHSVTDSKADNIFKLKPTNISNLQLHLKLVYQKQRRIQLNEKLKKLYDKRKLKHLNKKDQSEKVEQFIKDWQEKSHKILWLEGPYLSTMSSFLQEIYEILWKLYLADDHNPIPIFINLKNPFNFRNWDDLLAVVNISPEEKDILLKSGVVLLLSHFEFSRRFDFLNFLTALEPEQKEQKNSDSRTVRILISTSYCHLHQALNLAGWPKDRYEILDTGEQLLLPTDTTLLKDPFNTLERFYKLATHNLSWGAKIPSFEGFLEYASRLCHLQKNNLLLIDHAQHPDYLQKNIGTYHPTNPYFKLLSLLFVKVSYQNNKQICYGALPKELYQFLSEFKKNEIETKQTEIDKPEYSQQFPLKPVRNLQKLQDEKHGSVAAIQPGDQQYPIFAFYPLTGDYPNQYRDLFQSLGSNQPFCAFQMDTHNKIAENNRNMIDKAGFFADIIQNYSQTPCILVGWSFGGLLALQVAECLKKLNYPIAQMIVIDCPPPHQLRNVNEFQRSTALIHTLADEIYSVNEVTYFREHFSREYEQIKRRNLPATEHKNDQLTSVISDAIFEKTLSELVGHGGEPPLQQKQDSTLIQILSEYLNNNSIGLSTLEIIQIILSYLDSLLRGNFLKAMTHCKINLKAYYQVAHPDHPTLAIPLVIAEAKIKTENLNKEANFLEWKRYTSAKFSHAIFDGDHFNIFKNRKFIDYIRSVINQVQPLVYPLDLEQRIARYQQNYAHEIHVSDYITHSAHLVSAGPEDKKEVKTIDSEQRIDQFIEPFLSESVTSKKPICLVIAGEPGIGKTTLIEHIAYTRRDQSWITVRVDGVSHLVASVAATLKSILNLSDSETNSEVLRQKPFLFLLSEFDDALPSKNELSILKRRWPQAKVIFSCRSYYINYSHSFLPEFLIVALEKFNEHQITEYLKKHSLDFHLTSEIYQQTIKAFGLKSFINIPLNLSLVSSLLPSLQGRPDQPWSLTKVYLEFFASYKKNAAEIIDRREGLLPGVNLQEAAAKFTARLAYDMLNQEIYEIDKYFFSDDPFVFQVRQVCAPLLQHRNGKVYFNHQNYQDFFLAYYFLSTFDNETTQSWITANKLNRKFYWVFRFLAGLISLNQPNLTSRFFSRLVSPPHDLLGNYLLNLIDSCIHENGDEKLVAKYRPAVQEKARQMKSLLNNPKLIYIEKNSLPRFESSPRDNKERILSPTPSRTKITGVELEEILLTEITAALCDIHAKLKEKLVNRNIPLATVSLVMEVAFELGFEHIVKSMQHIKTREEKPDLSHLSALIERFRKFMLWYMEPGLNLDQYLDKPLEGLSNQLNNDILRSSMALLPQFNIRSVADFLCGFSGLLPILTFMALSSGNPNMIAFVSALSSRQGQKQMLSNICKFIVFENDEAIKRSCLSLWSEINQLKLGDSYCDMDDVIKIYQDNLGPKLYQEMCLSLTDNDEKKSTGDVKTSDSKQTIPTKVVSINNSSIILLAKNFISQRKGKELGTLLHLLDYYDLQPMLASFEAKIDIPFMQDFLVSSLAHPQLLPINKWMIIDFIINNRLLKELNLASQESIISSVISCLNIINKNKSGDSEEYYHLTRLGTSCLNLLEFVSSINLKIINTLLEQLNPMLDQMTLVSYSTLTQLLLGPHIGSLTEFFCHDHLIKEKFLLFLELLAVHGNPAWINQEQIHICVNHIVVSFSITQALLSTITKHFEKYAGIQLTTTLTGGGVETSSVWSSFASTWGLPPASSASSASSTSTSSTQNKK